MATFQRDNLFIVTSIEELPRGRYRGFVTITAGINDVERHICTKCWDDPLQAHIDADADVEYAYRRYLSSRINWQSGTDGAEH